MADFTLILMKALVKVMPSEMVPTPPESGLQDREEDGKIVLKKSSLPCPLRKVRQCGAEFILV